MIANLNEYPACRPVTLEGHVFDSLTLNKTLDTVLRHDGHFLITNVRIGHRKEDTSSVQMNLYARSEQALQELLEVLKVYGVSENDGTAHLEGVSGDGQLPHGAIILGYVPRSVTLAGGEDLAATPAAHDALVLVKAGNQLQVRPQSQLNPGDPVVVGAKGINW